MPATFLWLDESAAVWRSICISPRQIACRRGLPAYLLHLRVLNFLPGRLLSSILSLARWKLQITISSVRRIFIRSNYFSYSPLFFSLLSLSRATFPRDGCMSSGSRTCRGERRVMTNHAKSVRPVITFFRETTSWFLLFGSYIIMRSV